jgi:hypothetical protein
VRFIPVYRTAQVELRLRIYSQKVENVFYFKRNQDVDAASLLALATAVDGWWMTYVRAYTITAVTMWEVFAKDLTTENGPTASYTVHQGTAGTKSTSYYLPASVTLCISLRTAYRGRSYRGRSYTIGMADSHVSGNQAVAGYVTNMVSFWNVLRQGYGVIPADWDFSVVSRRQNKQWLENGIATHITSCMVVDSNIDCQRRRLTTRGQ